MFAQNDTLSSKMLVLLQENADFRILGPKCVPGGQKWLPGGFRGPLGRQVALLGPPRGARGGPPQIPKMTWRGPRAGRRREVDRFWAPGGSPGLPWRLSGGAAEAILAAFL